MAYLQQNQNQTFMAAMLGMVDMAFQPNVKSVMIDPASTNAYLQAGSPVKLVAKAGKGQIVVDGSSVHQLGAQCVQVLLSAKRTWSADGVALSIVNCPPRMIEDLRLLGIDLTTLTSGEQPL